MRRGTVLLMAVLRPFLYVLNRTFATRVVYSILRGISRDRLDLLGSEPVGAKDERTRWVAEVTEVLSAYPDYQAVLVDLHH